jgi:hypothetical protein
METYFIFTLLNDWYFFMESQKRRAGRKAQCCIHAIQRSTPNLQNPPPFPPQNKNKMKNWPALLKEGAWHSFPVRVGQGGRPLQ